MVGEGNLGDGEGDFGELRSLILGGSAAICGERVITLVLLGL